MKTLVVLLASRSHASTILAVVLCDTTVVSFQSIALSGSPLNQRPEHRSSLSLSISYSSNQKTQKSCSSRTLRPLFILPLSLSLCVSLSNKFAIKRLSPRLSASTPTLIFCRVLCCLSTFFPEQIERFGFT